MDPVLDDKYDYVRRIGKGSYGTVHMVCGWAWDPPLRLPADDGRGAGQVQGGPEAVLPEGDQEHAAGPSQVGGDVQCGEGGGWRARALGVAPLKSAPQVRLMQKLSHPNIVALREAMYSSDEHLIFIIMAYCDSGDLEQRIKHAKKTRTHFSEDQVLVRAGRRKGVRCAR